MLWAEELAGARLPDRKNVYSVLQRMERLWRAERARAASADKACDRGCQEPLEGFKADS